MYYTIGLMYSEYKNGIFSHIPFSSKVTTSEKEAQELFEYELRAYTGNWRGNKLLEDKCFERDSMCAIREAVVECNEAAYVHGYYLLQLLAFSFNPHE